MAGQVEIDEIRVAPPPAVIQPRFLRRSGFQKGSTARSSKARMRIRTSGRMDLNARAVNIILPWLWIRACEGKSTSVQNRVEQRYFAWPSAEDNSLLRLARQRLLGEQKQIDRVRESMAKRVFFVPWQATPPVGLPALQELARARPSAPAIP